MANDSGWMAGFSRPDPSRMSRDVPASDPAHRCDLCGRARSEVSIREEPTIFESGDFSKESWLSRCEICRTAEDQHKDQGYQCFRCGALQREGAQGVAIPRLYFVCLPCIEELTRIADVADPEQDDAGVCPACTVHRATLVQAEPGSDDSTLLCRACIALLADFLQ